MHGYLAQQDGEFLGGPRPGIEDLDAPFVGGSMVRFQDGRLQLELYTDLQRAVSTLFDFSKCRRLFFGLFAESEPRSASACYVVA